MTITTSLHSSVSGKRSTRAPRSGWSRTARHPRSRKVLPTAVPAHTERAIGMQFANSRPGTMLYIISFNCTSPAPVHASCSTSSLSTALVSGAHDAFSTTLAANHANEQPRSTTLSQPTMSTTPSGSISSTFAHLTTCSARHVLQVAAVHHVDYTFTINRADSRCCRLLHCIPAKSLQPTLNPVDHPFTVRHADSRSCKPLYSISSKSLLWFQMLPPSQKYPDTHGRRRG